MILMHQRCLWASTLKLRTLEATAFPLFFLAITDVAVERRSGDPRPARPPVHRLNDALLKHLVTQSRSVVKHDNWSLAQKFKR